MKKDHPESQLSAHERLVFPVHAGLHSTHSSTKFQQAEREDYLYSQNNNDTYYYEQRPPHWKN